MLIDLKKFPLYLKKAKNNRWATLCNIENVPTILFSDFSYRDAKFYLEEDMNVGTLNWTPWDEGHETIKDFQPGSALWGQYFG